MRRKAALDNPGLKVRSDRASLRLKVLTLVSAPEIVGLPESRQRAAELAEAINGLMKAEAGNLSSGRDIANQYPPEVIDAGMGYIPEVAGTRRGSSPPLHEGKIFILKDAGAPRFSSRSFLKLMRLTAMRTAAHGVRHPRPRHGCGAWTLSGGNIQKVLLAR